MSRQKLNKFGHYLGLFLVFAVVILAGGERKFVSAENFQQRVRYQITTIKEGSSAEREVLSQTTVEGLPGTDFKIELNTGNFKMEAHFINDLSADNRLKVRAHLTTRRFYGYSPHSLPLYEEDDQTKNFESDFSDTIVLLPFGNGAQSENSNASPSSETLRIEITPTLLTSPSKDRASELTINFDKPIPSGEISIVAEKIPHRFNIEARIETGGRVVARGSRMFSFAEEGEISIAPTPNDEVGMVLPSLKAKIIVDQIIRNRPRDLAGIKFELYQAIRSDSEVPSKIISQGTGIGVLGGEITYPLGKINGSSGEEYQLILKVLSAEEDSISSDGT